MALKKEFDNYEWFYNEYIVKQKSQAIIAEEQGTSTNFVLYRLKKYGINARKPSERNKIKIILKFPKEFDNYEWFYNEYIIKQRSMPEIADFLGIERRTVKRRLKKYGIKIRDCNEYNKILKGNMTKEEKDIMISRLKETCLKRYGVESVLLTDKIKEKSKQTCLDKYGCKNPLQNKEVRDKIKQTNLDKYGVEHISQTEWFKEKSKQTCLDRYGVDNPNKLQEIKDKKVKTCLKRYGVDSYLKTKEFRKICKENKEEIRQKVYLSKKQNKTFNTSKPEKQLEKLLKQKYPNLITQYKSEKYPFNCDFYIPSLDLYIEYQGHWTHGKEPFNKDSEKHIEILEEMKIKSETSKFYKSAIEIWTEKDPLKREIALKNGLNYIEIWEINDIYKI